MCRNMPDLPRFVSSQFHENLLRIGRFVQAGPACEKERRESESKSKAKAFSKEAISVSLSNGRWKSCVVIVDISYNKIN